MIQTTTAVPDDDKETTMTRTYRNPQTETREGGLDKRTAMFRYDDEFELDCIIDEIASDPDVDPLSIAIVAADGREATFEFLMAA